MPNSTNTFVLSGSTGQVCRPHFHSPLHPWDASKSLVPHAHSAGWISPFSTGKGSLSHPSSSPLGHSAGPTTSSANPFNFPPTPPKDSTPDVSGSGANAANGAAGPNGAAPGTSSNNDYSPAGDQHSNGNKDGSLNGDNNGYSSAGAGIYSKKLDGHGSLADNPYSSSGLTSYPSSVYSYPGSALYTSSKSPATIKAENHHGGLSGDSPGLNHYSSALSSYSPSLSSMGGSMGSTAHPMPTYAYMGPDYTSSALFHPANMLKAASLARCRTKTRSSSGEGERTFAY